MTTSFTAPAQETRGGSLSSHEGKRNRKAQALSALLSASALGVFLEGCAKDDPVTVDPVTDPGGGNGGGNNRVNLPSPEQHLAQLVGESFTSSNLELSALGFSFGGYSFRDSNGGRITITRTNGGPINVESSGEIVRTGGSSSPDTVWSTADDSLLAQPIVFFAEEEGIQGDGPIVGSDQAEYIVGGSADQSLSGRGGNDILEGRGGADILDGGADTDTASYATSEAGVTVSLVAGATQSGGDAAGDTLTGIENLVGSAQDDSLTGDKKANALYGMAGADTLEGKDSGDLLVGGAGADTYLFGEGDGADTIVEVVEQDIVNTLKFVGDYEVSDFSFVRDSEDSTDLVIVVDTNGDGDAENEVTLEGYFVSDTSEETAYSIEIQINEDTAFAVPAVEG